MNTPLKIAIRGAGVTGLWQALTLARRGHSVILAEQSAEPFTNACSPYAGAMLAPRCEEESAEPIIRELGERGIALWKAVYPALAAQGSLVVAPPRDRKLLDRFERMTQDSERPRYGAARGAGAEPEPPLWDRAVLRRRSTSQPKRRAVVSLERSADRRALSSSLALSGIPPGADIVIDCRGLAAKTCSRLAWCARRAHCGPRSGDRHSSAPCDYSIRAFRSTSYRGATDGALHDRRNLDRARG